MLILIWFIVETELSLIGQYFIEEKATFELFFFDHLRGVTFGSKTVLKKKKKNKTKIAVSGVTVWVY